MVEEIDPARVADAIRAGELDLALIHDYDFVTPQPDPGLDSMPLLDESMYLASPPPSIRTDWTAAAPKEARDPIRRWRDAPWIMAAPGTLCHAMALRACEAAGFAPRVRHHVDDFSTVLALVAVGQGVALVPQFGTTDATAELVLTPLAMRRRTRIAFRRGAADHPAIAAFTTALRGILPHP